MSKQKKSGFIGFLLLIIIVGAGGFYIYKKFFNRVQLKDKNYTYIFIDRDDTFEDVINDINAEHIIENTESFEWLAKSMGLDKNINPGRFRINNGMSMRQIISMIKNNKQEKVKLTYNYQIHDLEEFISYTDDKLEITETELDDFLTDEAKLNTTFELDPDTRFALITPGVYEVSWAITCDELFSLLKERYWRVWNTSRISQAKALGYTVPEIITLASIVQSESTIQSEQQKIAGVYINRLKCNMPLQADPTLRFANKAFTAQRFWNSDKETNSPYNTYRYKGLPPGPICLVYPQAIDATLSYSRHKFMYFCAKPQLNGLSDFSVTYSQHEKFASAYKKSMNKRGINR